MRTNQADEPVQEDYLYSPDALRTGEAAALLFLILDRMDLEAWRTNATKHGNVELQLRPRS